MFLNLFFENSNKNTNYYVDYMVYVSLLGKSLFAAFGKGFLGFRKIFTPAWLLYAYCTMDAHNNIQSKHFAKCTYCKVHVLQSASVANFRCCKVHILQRACVAKSMFCKLHMM